MKEKKYLYIAGLLLLAIGLLLTFKYRHRFNSVSSSTTITDKSATEPILGIYNRNGKVSVELPESIPHFLISLGSKIDQQEIRTKLFSKSDARILITVESGGDHVLARVIDGDLDGMIESLCEAFPKENKNIYLRWNPEMEVPVKVYSWQYQSPEAYVEAFRHFSKVCKQFAPSVHIVWGPAGYPGAEEYWPGADLVDIVTITLDSKSELSATIYPVEKDRVTDIRRKIHRVRFIDKPLFVLASEKMKSDSTVRNQLAAAIKQTEKEAATIYVSFQESSDASQNNDATGKPLVGVYDPKQLLLKSPALGVEHIFMDLGNIQDGTFEKELMAIVHRGHEPIVSIEPWRDKKMRKDTINVLLNTINGVYDAEFNEVFRVIADAKKTVYLRFAHEMEIPIHRYLWQSQDPVLYIKAFRYFMSLQKKGTTNVRRVWGPAGDRGSMEWWPGGDVVDYVSVAIYGLPDKDITDPTRQESFETIYNRKNHRVLLTGKPIFVTEFGVKGPEDFQSEWMENAAETINKHQEIVGVCYFNLADNPKVWGNIPAPDWGISKETFDHFVQTLSDR
jgi:beta-mannanase